MESKLEILQIIQVALFSIPTVYFLILGLFILLRPVTVLNRRWLLLVFLPLLMANPLAFAEADLQNGIPVVKDWAFWVLLGVDLVLAGGVLWFFRGYDIYGLSEAQVRDGLVKGLRAQGREVEVSQGARNTLLFRSQNATILNITQGEAAETIWLMARAGEVVLQSRSWTVMNQLRPILASLRSSQRESGSANLALGVLYLVLAVVFAVLTWIFFFEPRILVL